MAENQRRGAALPLQLRPLGDLLVSSATRTDGRAAVETAGGSREPGRPPGRRGGAAAKKRPPAATAIKSGRRGRLSRSDSELSARASFLPPVTSAFVMSQQLDSTTAAQEARSDEVCKPADILIAWSAVPIRMLPRVDAPHRPGFWFPAPMPEAPTTTAATAPSLESSMASLSVGEAAGVKASSKTPTKSPSGKSKGASLIASEDAIRVRAEYRNFLATFCFGAASGVFELEVTCSEHRRIVHEVVSELNQELKSLSIVDAATLPSDSLSASPSSLATVSPADLPFLFSSASFGRSADLRRTCVARRVREDEAFERLTVRARRFIEVQGEFVERAAHVYLGNNGNQTAIADATGVCTSSMADAASADSVASVSLELRAKRRERDGALHHITIVTADEIKTMAGGDEEQVEACALQLLNQIADAYALAVAAARLERDGQEKDAVAVSSGAHCDWRALGLGRVVTEDGSNEALFVVVDWPSMNAVRVSLGLAPRDLHITLGYTKYDIHDQCKGPASIVSCGC